LGILWSGTPAAVAIWKTMAESGGVTPTPNVSNC
jgi:hypothetical protein